MTAEAQKLTRSAISYFLEADELHALHSFLGSIVGAVDTSQVALEAEAEKIWYGEYLGKPREIDVAAITAPVSAARVLDSFSELLNEISLCRVADNFLSYTSELLTELFLTREETLNVYGDRQFKLKDLLRVASREEMIKMFAQRVVREYAYSSFFELEKQIRERHGLLLAEPTDEYARMSELIATRNNLVHNRGIVNEDYLQRVPKTKYALGDALDVHWTVASNLQRTADRMVLAIDRQAAERFSLVTEQIPDSCLPLVYYSAGRVQEMLECMPGAEFWQRRAARSPSGQFSSPDADQDCPDQVHLDAQGARAIIRDLVSLRWAAFNESQAQVAEANSPEGMQRRALEAIERVESKDRDLARRMRALVDTHPRLAIVVEMGAMTIEEAEKKALEGPD